MNVRLLIATHIGMQFHCESQSVIYGNNMPISVINIKIIEKNQDDPDSSTLENTCCIFTIFYTKTCWVSGPVQALLASSINDISYLVI